MLENYLELVNSYLKISTTEKKVFAEVMTDFSIVNEMLDLFDQNDFKNPNLTYFGPTCGMGNFQVKIVERLMNGLKDWQPDPEKRLKHILENQICENEYIVKFIDNGIYINGIYIISDKSFKFTIGRWFNIDKTTGFLLDFDDYFYSKKENRKKKLEKLNSL